jgi:succinate dehydrogenase / fumarate reductase membrane anchor subunit
MTRNPPQKVKATTGFDTLAWKWMRYSAFLLIPLAWGHVLIQDILMGGHNIDLDYVSLRWSMIGWRIYDFCLLSFAFAHGINGLRQVLFDYILSAKHRRWAAWGLLAAWVIISAIGAVAIIGGVRMD